MSIYYELYHSIRDFAADLAKYNIAIDPQEGKIYTPDGELTLDPRFPSSRVKSEVRKAIEREKDRLKRVQLGKQTSLI